MISFYESAVGDECKKEGYPFKGRYPSSCASLEMRRKEPNIIIEG